MSKPAKSGGSSAPTEEPENGLNVARRPDGTWPKGVSGNPAGPSSAQLSGRPKLTHWLEMYVAGEDISHAPKIAQKLVKAMVRDAISKPRYTKDGEKVPGEGCPTTRSQILDRLDGPVVKKVDSTRRNTFEREVVVFRPAIGKEQERPEWPAEVKAINEAEEASRTDAEKRRLEALGRTKEDGKKKA